MIDYETQMVFRLLTIQLILYRIYIKNVFDRAKDP